MPLFSTDLVQGPSGELVSKAIIGTMGTQGWWQFQPVHEPFTGAFQRVITESPENLTSNSTVYACIWRISADVGKMRVKLIQDPDGDDVWQEIRSGSPYLPVLRKPNAFQTRQQFFEHWMQLKLEYGNAYFLKERDNRGVVTALYPLHPSCVTPLVLDDGDIWYQVRADSLAQVEKDVAIPAREIIHDRMMCLYHPLVGIPPLLAAALTGTLGIKIQQHATSFFANRARPGGALTTPGDVSKEKKEELKQMMREGYTGANAGMTMVLSNGMTFQPISHQAEQSQLVEQLQLTGSQIAQAFGVPLHKLGIGQPYQSDAAAQNQNYFADTIHPHVEAIETLLDEGLNIAPYATELDVENLLRMDQSALMNVVTNGVKSTVLSVNEARNKLNYPVVDGGKEPLAQQQMWPLGVLADRAPPDAGSAALPAPEPTPEENAETEARALIETIRKGFEYAV